MSDRLASADVPTRSAGGAQIDVKRGLTVEIAIEQVTIEGFGPRNGALLKLALERELAHLVRERGIPVSWGQDAARDVVDVPLVRWDGRGAEAGLVTALASQLYTELDR